MSDITLAVGDGARRMTYAELARAKGISLTSARQLVRRHHWPKQMGNDGYVKITVPLAALTHVNTQDRDTGSDRGTSSSDTASRSNVLKTRETPDTVSASGEAASEAPSERGSDTVSEVLSRAVDSLREQLGIANDRAERAERRIDELQAALADEGRRLDASEGERRQLSERLQRLLTHRQSGSVPQVTPANPVQVRWPWWRRWFR